MQRCISAPGEMALREGTTQFGHRDVHKKNIFTFCILYFEGSTGGTSQASFVFMYSLPVFSAGDASINTGVELITSR